MKVLWSSLQAPIMAWRLAILLFIAAFCGLTRSIEYHFIPKSMSWDSALSYCRSHFTDLASVSNSTQRNQLQNTALGNPAGVRTGLVWIGLLDDLSTWSWSRFENGLEETPGPEYRNWEAGQPDNVLGSQMCVQMGAGGLWQDEDCLLKKAFICYIDRDPFLRTNPQYFFIGEEMSRADAQSYCRDIGLSLARIRDSGGNSVVKNIASNQEVWIGLHRRRVWSDGTKANIEYWRSGQPDNMGGAQHCTAMDLNSRGQWSDENCRLELPFICHGSQEHMMGLDVQLNSQKPLTDDQLRDLVSTEFRQVLINLGLPDNIETFLKTTKLNETIESAEAGEEL